MRLTNIFMMIQRQGNGPGFPFPGDGDFPGNEDNNPFEPAASIDANLCILFAVAVVLIVIVNIKKSHWKAFKAWFLEWSRDCPNETKW